MPESFSLLFYALAIVLFLGALAAGWVANSAPVSPRKGRAKFWGYACAGLAFVAIGIPILLYQVHQHPVAFTGTIVTAHTTGGRATDSTLHVQLKNGCPLVLHASGTSSYFHPGQSLQGRYTPGDGTLLAAKFLDGSGKQQGVFNGRTYYFIPYGAFLIGAFLVVSAWLLYRRDPLGKNNAGR